MAGVLGDTGSATVEASPPAGADVIRPETVPAPSPVLRLVRTAPQPPGIGQRSWAVERVRCAAPDQARLLLVSGKVTGSSGAGESISLRPERRYHLNFDRTATGISGETDKCVPVLRYCYGQKSFESFGGSPYARGVVAQFGSGRYASGVGKAALEALVQHAVWRECGISPAS